MVLGAGSDQLTLMKIVVKDVESAQKIERFALKSRCGVTDEEFKNLKQFQRWKPTEQIDLVNDYLAHLTD